MNHPILFLQHTQPVSPPPQASSNPHPLKLPHPSHGKTVVASACGGLPDAGEVAAEHRPVHVGRRLSGWAWPGDSTL